MVFSHCLGFLSLSACVCRSFFCAQWSHIFYSAAEFMPLAENRWWKLTLGTR
jgi:hypothetical protein